MGLVWLFFTVGWAEVSLTFGEDLADRVTYEVGFWLVVLAGCARVAGGVVDWLRDPVREPAPRPEPAEEHLVRNGDANNWNGQPFRLRAVIARMLREA